MADRPVDQREFGELLTSLGRGSLQPRDHIVKIKALVAQNTITCSQLAQIIDVVRTIQIESIVAAYSGLSDPENLDTQVLGKLKWQEERDEVKQKLGLA